MEREGQEMTEQEERDLAYWITVYGPEQGPSIAQKNREAVQRYERKHPEGQNLGPSALGLEPDEAAEDWGYD